MDQLFMSPNNAQKETETSQGEFLNEAKVISDKAGAESKSDPKYFPCNMSWAHPTTILFCRRIKKKKS